MPERRVSLPGAGELFRNTTLPAHDRRARPTSEDATSARGTGRVRHQEKITIYISPDELVQLEQARLTLRADHAVAVDRGRIVREAIALALEELAANGEDSQVLARLRLP